MTEENKAKLNVVNKPIAVAADGNILNVQKNGAVDLTFFQVVQKQGDTIDAIGVSSIRMDIDQLKKLADIANQAVEEYKKKNESKQKNLG